MSLLSSGEVFPDLSNRTWRPIVQSLGKFASEVQLDGKMLQLHPTL